jgi:probable biosynthetic protein (TIGR04098 family)
MLRSRSRFHLGMPHTVAGSLSEVALLAHAAHLRWMEIYTSTGCPSSRLLDANGRSVYASVYFVDIDGFPARGLGAFVPDDVLDVVTDLTRFGRSMLDGTIQLYPPGELPAELPADLPAGPYVRLSNVFVCEETGPQDLRISPPANAPIENIPSSSSEPDSYRLIKDARRDGCFFPTPVGAIPLWSGARRVTYTINPDRDVNGVGLVYFAHYVAFMDFAERQLLQATGHYTPEALDGRATRRRRIGYYGNTQRHGSLDIEVEAATLPGAADHLLLHFRIQRPEDGRLIAVSSVEKVLHR